MMLFLVIPVEEPSVFSATEQSHSIREKMLLTPVGETGEAVCFFLCIINIQRNLQYVLC